MTQWRPSIPSSQQDVWKRGLLVLCRILLWVSVLFAAYFLIPARTSSEGSGIRG